MKVVRRFKALKRRKSSWQVMKILMTNNDDVDKLKLNNDDLDKQKKLRKKKKRYSEEEVD